MRSSWFTNGLLAAVLVGLGVLLYALRGRDQVKTAAPATTSGGGGDAARSGRPPPRPLPDLPPGAQRDGPGEGERPARQSPPDAAPLGELPPVTPDLVADLDEAHGHLQDAARPCAAGKSLPGTAYVRFSYRLTVTGGKASTADVTLVDLAGGAEPLETCVLEKVAGATWEAGGRDRTTTVDDHLTVKELQN